MSDGDQPDRLARLGERLGRARARDGIDPERQAEVSSSAGVLGTGFRIGIELVAALCVGLALGWVTDRFLGTGPWGLIGFFFLGAGAGTMNVFRAAKGIGYGNAGPPPRQ